MANPILFLNQDYVQGGLGTLTYTVPATIPPNGVAVSSLPLYVRCAVTAPQAVAEGAGAGSGSGYGAGKGGGTLSGFAVGGGGLGDGASGQGFGADTSGYQQPPLNVSTQSSIASVLSQLSVVVNQNGTPVYTSPMLAGNESELNFKTPILVNAGDAITIVLSSSLANDNANNAIKAIVSIAQG